MTVLRVRWYVEDVSTELETYDTQKVYWSATEGGSYVEATTSTTRVSLVSGQSIYYFDYNSVGVEYWFKTSFFNSVSLAESTQSAAFQAPPKGGYLTVTDAKTLGSLPVAVTDDEIVASILVWSEFLDQATRQWFEPRSLDIKVDSHSGRTLFIPIAIISVSALYVNGDFTNAISTSEYEVYNNLGEGVFDDRKNPRISLSDTLSNNIYRTSLFTGEFTEGHNNQRVVGLFGWVEPDGSVPLLIEQCVLRLVKSELGTSTTTVEGAVGPKISETTDGHTIRWQGTSASSSRQGTLGMTNDPYIERAIAFFKTPKAMGIIS
jgi:hypothetical protein